MELAKAMVKQVDSNIGCMFMAEVFAMLNIERGSQQTTKTATVFTARRMNLTWINCRERLLKHGVWFGYPKNQFLASR